MTLKVFHSRHPNVPPSVPTELMSLHTAYRLHGTPLGKYTLLYKHAHVHWRQIYILLQEGRGMFAKAPCRQFEVRLRQTISKRVSLPSHTHIMNLSIYNSNARNNCLLIINTKLDGRKFIRNSFFHSWWIYFFMHNLSFSLCKPNFIFCFFVCVCAGFSSAASFHPLSHHFHFCFVVLVSSTFFVLVFFFFACYVLAQ